MFRYLYKYTGNSLPSRVRFVLYRLSELINLPPHVGRSLTSRTNVNYLDILPVVLLRVREIIFVDVRW